MRKEDFFTRHSIKPEGSDLESSQFEGISEKGVELAREQAREILEALEKSKSGTVMFIGGSSEIARTRSTALIYGDEIKNLISKKEQNDILVLLPEDLEKIEGYSNKVNYLVKEMKDNPSKKIILDFPLFIKEFSFKGSWIDDDGELMPYTRELLRRNENNSEKALIDWLENQGKIGDLKGPDPKEVAEQQLAGMERLREFAQKYTLNRPLIIGSVGHSWSLDALALYLANKGEVNKEGFDKIKAKMIGESKMIKLTEQEGKKVLQYGDLTISLENE